MPQRTGPIPMLDAWLAANAGEKATFVINLVASASPQALVKPPDPALAPFSFFMSRRVEDGRERFRLHWGPFSTRAEAEHHLASVRNFYPAAWIAEHPAKPRSAAPEPAPSRPQSHVELPAVARPREVERKAASVSEAPKPPALAPPSVLLPAVNSWVAFVVQLRSSKLPLDVKSLPPLPTFDGRVTYEVTIQKDGERWHALRLGFFDDLEAARRVARQLRESCPTAEIVAVTPAEWSRIRQSPAGPSEPPPAHQPAGAPRRKGLAQFFARRAHRS